MLESFYKEFNKDLAQDEILYDIKEYMSQIKLRYNVEVNLSINDIPTGSLTDFCITQEMIPNGVNVQKILKKKMFTNGIDYIVVNVGFMKKQYRMTHMTLRKVLLLSGEVEYIEYYLFLDSIVKNYYHYQKQHERKTMLDSRRKIENLEKVISSSRAIEFEDF